MTGDEQEDRAAMEVFRRLDPARGEVDALWASVQSDAERLSRSIGREWVDMLRDRPLGNGALVLAAVSAFLTSAPAAALSAQVVGALVRH